MKTNQLIDVLNTDLEPVDAYKLVRSLTIATVIGLILASVICVLVLGVRPDLSNPAALEFLCMKVGFAGIVSIIGGRLLLAHSRPGGETQTRIFLAGVPFLALLMLAALDLTSVPSSRWVHLVAGERLLQCVLSIPLMAVLPFVVIVRATRDAAPTNLLRTAALAGLVAGGIGAMAYALHCPNDSLPFVAVWYCGAIALCTLAGAAVGPRFLRW